MNHLRMIFLIAIVYFILLVPHLAFSETYVNSEMRYKISYSIPWSRSQSNINANLILTGNSPECTNKCRAFINASYTPQLSHSSYSQFKNKIPLASFPEMVEQLMPGMSVKKVIKLEETSIGNRKGYLAELILAYPDGATRYATYGFVFDHGYFYHLQFFFNENNFEQCKKHAYTAMGSFKIL